MGSPCCIRWVYVTAAATAGRRHQALLQKIENGAGDQRLSMRVLWKAVVEGLQGVFPDPSGQGLGDCWTNPSLGDGSPGSE